MFKKDAFNIEDEEQYEVLRRVGMDEEKAARIANIARRQSGKRGKLPKYKKSRMDEN